MFVGLGQKEKLTWIVHVPTLAEWSRKYVSPRFETTGGVCWRIRLWSEFISGGDIHFCSLTREKDNGPPEVHYSFYFALSVGKERPEDGARLKKSPTNKTFSEGSEVCFFLPSLGKIRRSVDPVKLILNFHLQRHSFQSLRANSFSVSTVMVIATKISHHCLRNNLYDGEKDVSVPEEKNITEDIQRNVLESHRNRIRVGGRDDEANPWYPIFYQMNVNTLLHEAKCHLLDIHDQIYVSSELQRYETGPARAREDRIHVIEKEDLFKNADILSREGEISLLMELKGACRITRSGRSVSLFSPRKEADLCHDMTRFFQSRSKNANVKIRAGGKILKAHKEILAARSPVFSAMLSTSMKEKMLNIIDIEDLNLQTMKNFLKFLYSGSFKNYMKWKGVRNLYLAADKYFALSLCRMCSRKLASCASVGNCEQLRILSNIFEDKELQLVVKCFDLCK
ncbi:Protein roadkill like protein [Argiope bruennichi]|uniref:Protein roadkill like protein n=1 Tax=Argiope bruennichi TaxID=94029 RepID=A0A8T0FD92_ARGBR|nr:Protein roadkill like protein [Argiope bruennichi]